MPIGMQFVAPHWEEGGLIIAWPRSGKGTSTTGSRRWHHEDRTGDPCPASHQVEAVLLLLDHGGGAEHSHLPHLPGLPGSRPVLNRRALEMGVMIAKFLDCKMTEQVWFSRKTYFYPDLPKNFQITQYDSPLGTDGHFT